MVIIGLGDHPDVGTMSGFVCGAESRAANPTRRRRAPGEQTTGTPLDGGVPEEPSMNKLSPELTRQVLQTTMHEKIQILLRAAELVRDGVDVRDGRPRCHGSEGPVDRAAGHRLVRRGGGGSGARRSAHPSARRSEAPG